MPEVSLSLTHTVVLLVLSAALAAALAIAVYRRTTPPIGPLRSKILMTLRAAGLFLVFFLVGEPVLSLITRTEQPPGILILIDDSRSMTIDDRTGRRSEQLQRILSSPELEALSSIGDVRMFTFGESVREIVSFLPESLRFQADHTDLTAALRHIRDQAAASNGQCVILLSDGNFTTGGNPMFEEEVGVLPVFSVAIGDTAEQRDVLIRSVLTNAVAYKGTRIPVRVNLRSSGARGERVPVTLHRGQDALDSRTIVLEPGVREYPVDLSWVPETSGSQRLSVNVGSLPDELTGRNNRSGFSIKVLESRMKVALIAAAPSPDVAFLRRGLEADSNIQVTMLVERGEGLYYGDGGDDLSRHEAIILAGFPGTETSERSLRLVRSAAEGGVGVMFIPARTLDHGKLSSLLSILPVSIEQPSTNERSVFFHAPEPGRDALLRLPESYGRDAWSGLPPLFALQTQFRAKPESEVHAVQRLRTTVTSEPILVSRSVNRRKSIAMLGYGLWRWEMLADRAHRGMFTHWMTGIVRWLSTQDDDRRIRIGPQREIFTAGDPIDFRGEIYDEMMRPVERAEIGLTLTGRNDVIELTMNSLGNGQYEAHLRTLPEGDYTFTAHVRLDGATMAQTSGAFTVGESNAEFVDTRTNAVLLRQLSGRSNGRYYSPDSLATLAADIRSLTGFRAAEVVVTSDVAFWNNVWSLVTAVLLFAVEWLLRKQSGML